MFVNAGGSVGAGDVFEGAGGGDVPPGSLKIDDMWMFLLQELQRPLQHSFRIPASARRPNGYDRQRKLPILRRIIGAVHGRFMLYQGFSEDMQPAEGFSNFPSH